MLVRVSGEERYVPNGLWVQLEGPQPPASFESNGCTMSPDRFDAGELEVWPACHLHDFHYSGRAGPITRRQADAVFRRNLRTVLRWQIERRRARGLSAPRWKAWVIPFVYWRAVRRLGAGHFRTPVAEQLQVA